jgi:hypothetical protein
MNDTVPDRERPAMIFLADSSKNGGAIPPLLHYAFMTWYSVKKSTEREIEMRIAVLKVTVPKGISRDILVTLYILFVVL